MGRDEQEPKKALAQKAQVVYLIPCPFYWPKCKAKVNLLGTRILMAADWDGINKKTTEQLAAKAQVGLTRPSIFISIFPLRIFFFFSLFFPGREVP